jgi:flagellar biosynthesis protein FliP
VALVGMQQLPVPVVSMPLKILLFLAVDGWGMLAAKMMGGGGQ